MIGGPSGSRTKPPRRWLLTGGLAVCSVCGAPLIATQVPRPGGLIGAYACSVRSRSVDPQPCGRVSVAPADVVEELVVAAAFDALESPGFAKAVLAGDDTDRAGIGDRLAAAEARVARAAELFGSGEVDEVTWRRMHTPAAAAMAAARAELAALTGRSLDVPDVDQARAEWAGLTILQRRQILAMVIDRVEILPRTGRRPADHHVRVAERLRIHWRNL